MLKTEGRKVFFFVFLPSIVAIGNFDLLVLTQQLYVLFGVQSCIGVGFRQRTFACQQFMCILVQFEKQKPLLLFLFCLDNSLFSVCQGPCLKELI